MLMYRHTIHSCLIFSLPINYAYADPLSGWNREEIDTFLINITLVDAGLDQTINGGVDY